jgi:hypothetical protein
MKKIAWLVAVVGFVASVQPTLSFAQCSLNDEYQGAASATKAHISVAGVELFQIDAPGGKWTVAQNVKATLAPDLQANKEVVLEFKDGAGTPVGIPVQLCPVESAAVPTTITRQDCRTTAQTWWAAKLAEDNLTEASSDIVGIVFTPDGDVCFTTPGYPAVGDRIIVGVAAPDDLDMGGTVGFDPCALEQTAPNIYIGDTSVFDEFNKQSTANVIVHELAERRCFNSSVKITWTQDDIHGETSVSQYDRFKATLQIGALFTDLHDREFGLQTIDGTTTILDKGPTDSGPEYVASLVIYGVPRYFQKGVFSGENHYRGRDVLHDNRAADRLGFVLSAGIDNFGDRFGVGLSFELFSGVNLTVSREYVKAKELVGLKLGDEFTGAAEDLPIQEKWVTDSVVGLSFDLRYFTALARRR